jgi:hypothetical protein
MACVTKADINRVIDNFSEYDNEADADDIAKWVESNLEDIADEKEVDVLTQEDLDRIWVAAVAEFNRTENFYSIAFVRGVKRGLNIKTPFVID